MQLENFPVSELEYSLLKNAHHMEPHHALSILTHWHQIASTELLEVLERVLGASIETLSPQDLFSAYSCYYQASIREDAEVRPRILSVLKHRMAEHLGQIDTSDLCQLVNLLGKNKDKKTL